MIFKLIRALFHAHKAISAARQEAVERRLDRLDVPPVSSRQRGSQTLVARSVLRAIEAWKPPKGSYVKLVVCVKLGKLVLFHTIKPQESEIDTVNQLDRLAYCLVVAEDPDLPDEWINELDVAWNLFEEKISHEL